MLFSHKALSTVLLGALSAVSVLSAPTPFPDAAPEASTDIISITDDLSARQANGCADVVAFFARGTTEPGTLGVVIGPGFQRALGRALGGQSLRFEGIPYPAVISGFLAGGDPGGARTMADRVTSTANTCPNSKIVISGYSQGAQVTHLAAAQLPAAIQERISAVVTFGDPNRSSQLPGNLEGRRRTFCNFGDLICTGQSIVLPPHLTYGTDANSAARFVADRV